MEKYVTKHDGEMLYVDIDRVFPNEWNSNVVNPINEEKLELSMGRFGAFKPVIVRQVGKGYEIIGGQHRVEAMRKLGYTDVPVMNLGVIDDETAKEISLVDNGRYGEDDPYKLGEILKSISVDVSEFLPYTSEDLSALQKSVEIDLDAIGVDAPDHEDDFVAKPEKVPSLYQTMRFKVPHEDAHYVTEVIEKLGKIHGFTDDDSLTNGGLALVQLCKEYHDAE
jgi:hypothetical protein